MPDDVAVDPCDDCEACEWPQAVAWEQWVMGGSALLFLLSGKKPSELQTMEGKKKLIAEIIATVDSALGVGTTPAAASAVEAAPAEGAASAPPAVQPAPAMEPKTTGVVDVLFTSFIIQ